MQRNFEPMRKQVEAWQRSELTDVNAKVVIYEAFVEGTYVLLTRVRLLPRRVSKPIHADSELVYSVLNLTWGYPSVAED